MTKGRLYGLVALACAAGFGWLGYSLLVQHGSSENAYGGCLFKYVTHIPCPSCGSTRSVICLVHGNWLQALYYNPFGILTMGIATVVPLWILADLVFKGDSFYRFYFKAETVIKKRWVALPLIALVLANWIWNIYKGV